jgi:hypothetical protein
LPAYKMPKGGATYIVLYGTAMGNSNTNYIRST